MTSNARESMQHPSSTQMDSPRRCDGMTTLVCNSTQAAKRADSTNAGHCQQCKDVHERGGKERVKARVLRMSKGCMDMMVGPRSGSGTPDMSDNSPRALTPSDKPVLQRTKSLSTKFEVERRAASSCSVGPIRDKVDGSGVSVHVKNPRDQLKMMQNTLELKHKCSEQKVKEDSPGRPREEPEDLGGKAVASGGVQSHLEHTRTKENDHVIEMNVLH